MFGNKCSLLEVGVEIYIGQHLGRIMFVVDLKWQCICVILSIQKLLFPA